MRYIIFIILTLFSFGGCAKTKEQKAIKIEDENLTIRLEGIVIPSVEETIIATSSGYVKEVYVEDGDIVKKGDLLYKLEQEDLMMDISKLKQDIKSAKNLQKKLQREYQKISMVNISAMELKKIAFLKSKGYLNDFEENIYKQSYINNLVQLQNDNLSTLDKLEFLKKSIEDKEFKLKKLLYSSKFGNARANADGFVTNLKISPNQTLSSGNVVCNILNISDVIVNGGLATGLLPFLHKGQKVKIEFVTSPPYSMFANITKINPIVDPKFQTMTVSIKIKNKDYLLQNGTRALITVYLPKKDQKKVRKMFRTKDTSVHIASSI